MLKDFLYLRRWITGEGYGSGTPPRPVILECIHSRSGMSMGVYDRGERIFTVNGYGFDQIGTALGDFLEKCFQPELGSLALGPLARLKLRINGCLDKWERVPGFHGFCYNSQKGAVSLDGAAGFESIAAIAQAIGLKVHRSESKSGTLIVIEKGI